MSPFTLDFHIDIVMDGSVRPSGLIRNRNLNPHLPPDLPCPPAARSLSGSIVGPPRMKHDFTPVGGTVIRGSPSLIV